MPRRQSRTFRKRDVKETRVFDGQGKKKRNVKKNRQHAKHLINQIDDFDNTDELYELYGEDE